MNLGFLIIGLLLFNIPHDSLWSTSGLTRSIDHSLKIIYCHYSKLTLNFSTLMQQQHAAVHKYILCILLAKCLIKIQNKPKQKCHWACLKCPLIAASEPLMTLRILSLNHMYIHFTMTSCGISKTFYECEWSHKYHMQALHEKNKEVKIPHTSSDHLLSSRLAVLWRKEIKTAWHSLIWINLYW